MTSSDLIEFGFDDGGVVRSNSIDFFKQTRNKEESRVSIISFSKQSESFFKRKAREGVAYTDQEKLEVITKMDERIAEHLKKDVKDVTEVDRLDLNNPKFWSSNVHFKEGLGTFRCLSDYHDGKVTRADICCKNVNDPTQTIMVAVLVYPVDRKNGGIDLDLLRERKCTEVQFWKLSAIKYGHIKSLYNDAQADNRMTIDLKVVMDGDPKYQKQVITTGQNAVWARPDMGPDLKEWVLDQGLRSAKHIERSLGRKLKKEELAEKLGLSNGSPALAASADAPVLNAKQYDDLLG